MDLTRLRAFLRHHRRIAVDTSVFIYQLEANPRYVGLTDPIFTWLERPDHSAVTSTITMTELLVQPYIGIPQSSGPTSFTLSWQRIQISIGLPPASKSRTWQPGSGPRIACGPPTRCKPPPQSRLRQLVWSRTTRFLQG